MRDLAGKTKTKNYFMKWKEITCVSNLGMFGMVKFNSIINRN
jgi:hypothetical protein